MTINKTAHLILQIVTSTFNPRQNNLDITDVIVTDVNVTSVFVTSPSVTTLATTNPIKSSKSLVMINPTQHYDTYICDTGGLSFIHMAHTYVTLVHTNCYDTLFFFFFSL